MERLPLESQYFMRYSMIRANHPCNTKIGVVCIYYKEYLPLTREIAIRKLNESIVTKITVNNKRCFLTCLYRSPNQNQEQFESFSENLIDVLSGINNQQPTYSIIMLVPKFILYYPQIWGGGGGGGVSLLHGLVVASLRINQIYKNLHLQKQPNSSQCHILYLDSFCLSNNSI